MEIEIQIFRPVNPTGKSFMTYVYGAVMGQAREVIENHKVEFTRLMQRLGFKIEEEIGIGKLITGTIVLVIDDTTKEPKSAYTKDLEVWKVEQNVKKRIQATL